MSQKYFYAGVDGGGTKCSAVIYSEVGDVLGRAVSGPANVARSGKLALDSVQKSVCLALEDAGLTVKDSLPLTLVSAGLAGAEVDSSIVLLKEWMHPFAKFEFTTDLHTACLGAHAGKDGAVLIVGTGSCCGYIVNGNFSQLGGHGFHLGDKGSGAWLGHQAAMYTLEAMDGVRKYDTLANEVCAHFQCYSTQSLVNKLNNASSALFGELAPLVLSESAHGTASARKIVSEAGSYLSGLIEQAVSKGAKKVSLLGGVAPHLIEQMSADIKPVTYPPQYGPEWGAVFYLNQRREIADAIQQHGARSCTKSGIDR